MRAVQFEGPGRVRVADVTDARVEDPGDALVRVTRAAICGSDLHAVNGRLQMEPGESLGHEGMGVVEEVGPGVTRFRTGDRVAIAFDNACGECWYCRRGETAL